jgi:Putative bacterial sensory transduction regulator
LQQAGYRAEITVDNIGDPMIKSSTAGVDYSIYFYDCENAQNCLSLQFSSGYDLPQGTSFQVMNDWHSTQRFGFAYLDSESDPYINYDVNMAYGVTADNFLDSLSLWDTILSNFQDHIGW